jgi:SOS-response transcriptional repressor LexA
MRKKTKELTMCQHKTLTWIIRFKIKTGMYPTVREIGQAFGIKSSSAQERLNQLIKKGYLRRTKRGSRTLSVVDRTHELINKNRRLGNRAELQSPFRQQDLMPSNTFILYCKECGIDTDEHELELYDMDNLLIPALKIKEKEIRKVVAPV